MKRCMVCLVALLALTGPITATSGVAAGARRTSIKPASSAVTFRLRVAGQPSGSMTFWVAYGPLDGHFGLIRLRPSGHGLYSAARRLPSQGHTIFAYLAGHGVLHTRFGAAPGNPVITIRRFHVDRSRRHTMPVVNWQAPVG